ncbi:DUF3558 domain-containing protein [Actinokineospora guangxiensis]|uniref:DUF3558 domain-containing protein n=1 Tax=Actinokineospora guangxiensis TaxID=1490288 RepID=A0ABW0EDZ6_9PSEU
MRLAAPAVLMACLLSGCSTTDKGSPVPTDDIATTTLPRTRTAEPTGPDQGTPQVSNPLDVSAFAADPCTSITKAQAGALGVAHPGVGEPAVGGKACLWRNESGGSVLLSVVTANGLDGVYGAKARGELAVFEELPPVEGFPAVVANKVDLRDTGDCTVWVGTSDEEMVGVALGQSRDKVGDKDPCLVAASVASQVITTMKAG